MFQQVYVDKERIAHLVSVDASKRYQKERKEFLKENPGVSELAFPDFLERLRKDAEFAAKEHENAILRREVTNLFPPIK